MTEETGLRGTLPRLWQRHRKTILLAALALAVMGTAAGIYRHYLASTRIAFVNFRGIQLARLERARGDQAVRIEPLALDALDRAASYPVVVVHGRGLELNETHIEQLREAGRRGAHLYVRGATNPEHDITNLQGRQLEHVSGYFRFGGTENYARLLNFSRVELDGKAFRSDPVQPPAERAMDVLFHLDDRLTFETVATFRTYYEAQGLAKPDAPTIALLTSVPGPFNANRDHVDAVIRALEARQWNVFPVASNERRLDFLREIEPDLVVLMPHGRLSRGRSREAIAWLRERNIPMLTALSVFEDHDEWIADQQGMAGGLLTLSVVLPELDGGVAPYAVAAQFEDEYGYEIFDAIPERLDTFCDLIERWLALKATPNRDKRVAIYYYKGPGKNAMTASNMEVVPSLLNLLRTLRDAGYTVEGLPATEGEFSALIQSQGPVLGPYARGAFDEYVAEGDPALVSAAQYAEWTGEHLEPAMREAVDAAYGPAPGEYMTVGGGDDTAIAVARVQFGNVVVLPQPMPGVGDDTFRLVHGTLEAPPHPYVASYLWTRRSFEADAVMHFGTHGSLEFRPWKQIALSSFDWSDALIGGIPHIYLYIMSNVGEGIIAKRRSYAATVTHLTPPFMEGGLYEGLRPLRDRLNSYRSASDGPVRAEHARTIQRLAVTMDLHVDLGLDSEAEWSDDDFFRLSNHVETIDGAKVVQGFYTLGNAFSESEIDGTAELMAIDPIAYGLARIDSAKGVAKGDPLDDAALFERRYRQPARRAYARRARGEGVETVLSDLVSPGDLERAHGPSELAESVLALKASVAGIDRHRHGLRDSSALELASVVRALDGGYVEPSPGGDPIVNPNAVPTGRNLFSIDAEQTPSQEAWTVGRRLAESLLDEHRRRHGAYPRKVAFTLWPTDFIGTEGATIGQIFYLLGVEPVWDPRGRVGDLRLIPSADLGRPRIDVVVQTAGQLRDLAASRLALINRAVAMAAEASDAGEHANFVHAGRLRAEEVMKERGFSPADARRYSTLRVFGGVNGNYGTAIMEMVERSDRWEGDTEVAGQYLRNMGAVYDQGELWSFYADGIFEAALADTEIVVQPRQSHTWGALSLDHVFEFMGGLSLAVRHVTGKDADAYFNDFRNMHRPRVTDLNETIWTEARSTLLNPAYIGEMQEGGASSAEHFAETFRNTFGWNVMKPAAIDDTLWDELYEVYVDDRYDLGVESFFRRENPYALQEMTAVMLETVRKGYWDASPQQVAVLAELHTRLVEEFEAGCSGFVCDNAALASFIAEHAPSEVAAAYRSELQRNLTPSVELTDASVVLSEQQPVEPGQANSTASRPSAERLAYLGAFLVAGLFLVALFVLRRLRSTA